MSLWDKIKDWCSPPPWSVSYITRAEWRRRNREQAERIAVLNSMLEHRDMLLHTEKQAHRAAVDRYVKLRKRMSKAQAQGKR